MKDSSQQPQRMENGVPLTAHSHCRPLSHVVDAAFNLTLAAACVAMAVYFKNLFSWVLVVVTLTFLASVFDHMIALRQHVVASHAVQRDKSPKSA